MILQRKAVDLTGWHLVGQADMLDALSYLSEQGWRGAISFDSSTSEWRMELNADSPTRQVIAGTGDWLVLDMGLRKLSDSECTDNYDEVGGS